MTLFSLRKVKRWSLVHYSVAFLDKLWDTICYMPTIFISASAPLMLTFIWREWELPTPPRATRWLRVLSAEDRLLPALCAVVTSFTSFSNHVRKRSIIIAQLHLLMVQSFLADYCHLHTVVYSFCHDIYSFKKVTEKNSFSRTVDTILVNVNHFS